MWPALFVLLTNGIVQVPPSRWQLIELAVATGGSTVQCIFEVKKGSTIQMFVTDRSEAERFTRGRSFRPLYSTGFRSQGDFRLRIAEAGSYVLILDNRIDARAPADVNLKLEIISSQTVIPRELPQERRNIVVALSLLFFGFVIVFSAHQFLKSA